MIEYLYDAIRADAGQELVVSATITTDDSQPLTSGCSFCLYNDKGEVQEVQGSFNTNTSEWNFVVPERVMQELPTGRYWYCIKFNNQSLSFKQPLYLV